MKKQELNNRDFHGLTDGERRKLRKTALFKLLAMSVFAAVVIIFGSIAYVNKKDDR